MSTLSSNTDNLNNILATINNLPAPGITEETDPTVPAWAKEPTKPTYTAEEVGAATEDYVDAAIQAVEEKIPTINYPVTSVNGKTGAVSLNATDVGALPNTTTIITAQQVGDAIDAKIINKADKSSVPTNIVDANAYGSLKTIGAKEESDEYKLGQYAFAEGSGTTASGNYSHAEGRNTIAYGVGSHAEGYLRVAFGENSHAEGYDNLPTQVIISGDANSKVYTLASIPSDGIKIGEIIALDNPYVFARINSFDEASLTITLNKTLSTDAIVEMEAKIYTGSSGYYSHAEGDRTIASGQGSHAEGNRTTASGNCSHAEGSSTTASGNCSHAEGDNTTASGQYSHAEGLKTIASGPYSHAEGDNTTASGQYSHAEGNNTTASGNYQHVQGRYNIEDTNNKYIHIVGNGSSTSRSNAHTLDWNGNAWFAGEIRSGGEDYEHGSALASTDYVDAMIGDNSQALGGRIDTLEQNIDSAIESSKDFYINLTPYETDDSGAIMCTTDKSLEEMYLAF